MMALVAGDYFAFFAVFLAHFAVQDFYRKDRKGTPQRTQRGRWCFTQLRFAHCSSIV